MTARRLGDFALYRRILNDARPFWPALALLGLTDLLKVPLLLLQPIPLKIIVDNVLGGRALPEFLAPILPSSPETWQAGLWVALGLMIGVTLLDKVRTAIGWVLNTHTGEQLSLRFRARLLQHLQRVSLSYHDTAGTADSIYRVERDAESIRSICIGFMPHLVALGTLVGMLFVTWRIDWQLALVALIGSPITIGLILTQRKKVRTRWDMIYEHQSRALAVVYETLSLARVVRAFGRERHQQERFVREGQLSADTQLAASKLEAGLDALIGLMFTLSSAAVLLLGVLHIRSGQITLGELLIFMAYTGQLYGPLETLTRLSADLQSAFAAAARSYAVLDIEPDIESRPNARSLKRARGQVEFRGVSFAYTPESPVLDGISFQVPAGTRVGIFGSTGAGKTTLINLLARFYDPTRGAILLDGIDLRDYRLSDLRNQFAIVLQEPVLFSTSVAENIAYARPEAAESDIVAAATAANAHDFIQSLPNGYDSLVGDRGMRLSGGERQRISLARAFLKNAPILILDEPTSSVDLATEAGIIESMQRLMAGRTTFMIAHRLSTLDVCEMRIELDHGRVVSLSEGAPFSMSGADGRGPGSAAFSGDFPIPASS